MAKLIIASLVFIVYCVLFGIFWLQDLSLQLAAMLLSIVISCIRPGWRSTRKNLLMLSPFVGMLMVVYGVFILLGISPGETSALSYWVSYGLPRAMLLVSTLMVFRICFSFVNIDDLIRSPLSIHRLKYLILGKILYSAAFHSFRELRQWQDLSPGMRKAPGTYRERFQRNLAATLALVLYTLAEAQNKGQRIDDLILHCHKEER